MSLTNDTLTIQVLLPPFIFTAVKLASHTTNRTMKKLKTQQGNDQSTKTSEYTAAATCLGIVIIYAYPNL
ncbi:predicted protein [Lichtheimia corymbifera JMRC:FSU:9682]|uniref:Uncharacterized protein n=1 Tax=Lichtheimia corymbifera JMRC:FSU:9682 TaxID=1263082 RepID=A0A068SEI2_9FUNG|nr:predicted protein [Lichtheimia corymbifera JMRC:FSU:9682]